MNTFCNYFNAQTCQSCRYIEIDYQTQLARKEALLKSTLSSFANYKLLPSVTSKSRGFRNKAKLTVTGTIENPIIGLLGEKEMDQGREILNCPVHFPAINGLLSHLPDFIRLAKLRPYGIDERRGELKGIIVYHSEDSNECYLRLILRSKESIDRIRKQADTLLSRFPPLKCISVNIQPIPHAILEGDEEIILTERKHIRYGIKSPELRLGPKGFVQTNELVAGRLYQTAADWARELKVKRFAELFCGQGAFSFFMSDFVEQSVGFEINPAAVAEANASAEAQGIQNLVFKCADASSVENDLRSFKPDLVLVNPPRRGLSDSLHIMKDNAWPHVIYSSCSLESLARDLQSLRGRYEIEKIQLFDMFPHTEHFETLVLLRVV